MIRPATLDDLEAVTQMAAHWGAALPLAAHYPVSPERVQAFMASLLWMDNAVALVAKDGGAVVGMCGAVLIAHPLLTCQMASVVAWWVEPESRGRLGVQLLRRVKAWAADRGANVLQVSVPVGFEDAAAVCQTLGFSPSEQSWTLRE